MSVLFDLQILVDTVKSSSAASARDEHDPLRHDERVRHPACAGV
jgi:hypothetical protein